MRILFQLRRKVINILRWVLALLGVGGVIVLVFTGLYYIEGQPAPFQISMDVFLGIQDSNIIVVHWIIVVETIIRELYVLLFGGTVLARVLKPLTPIIVSRYIVYNDNLLRFRYWILYPHQKYLYDLNIRAVIVNKNDLIRGTTASLSEPKMLLTQESLKAARGVRYVDVSFTSAEKELFDTLMKNVQNQIYLLIQGTDESGVTFNIAHSYYSKSVLKDCSFVSIRATEFQESPTEYFRYHYFDKVTSKNVDKARNTHKDASKDILGSEQLDIKQFKGSLQTRWYDIVSAIARLWLNH